MAGRCGAVRAKLDRLRGREAPTLNALVVAVPFPVPTGGSRPRALDFGCGIGGWLGT